MKKLLFIILLAHLMYSCSIDLRNFDVPTWETKLRVTLLDQIYSASDLLPDSEADTTSFENINGIMCFVSKGELIKKFVSSDALFMESPDIMQEVPLYSGPGGTSRRIELAESDNRILKAKVSTGELVFTFTDIQDLYFTVTISITELLTPAGYPYVRTFTSNEIRNQPTIPIDLQNYTFDSTRQPYLQYINFSIETSDTNPTYQYLCNLVIHFDELILLDYIEGWIRNLQIKSDEDDFDSQMDLDIKYPINIENALTLLEPRIEFDFINYIGFDFQLTTDALTINDRNDIILVEERNLLGVGQKIERSTTVGTPIESPVLFDKRHGVRELLAIAPNKVELSNTIYSLWEDEDNLPGFIKVGQYIEGNYKVIIPFQFDLDAGVEVLPHPDHVQTITLRQQLRDAIKKNAQDFTFDVKIENNFNAAVYVSLYLASEKENLFGDGEEVFAEDDYSLTRVVFKNYYIQKRYPNGPYKEEYPPKSFEEEGLGIGIFYKYENIYFDFTFSFDNDDNVSVAPSDYIKVLAGISVPFYIDPEDM